MTNIIKVSYNLTPTQYRKLIKLRFPFELKRLGAGRFICILMNNPLTRTLIFIYGYLRKRKVFTKDVKVTVELNSEKVETTVLSVHKEKLWRDAMYMIDLKDFLTIEFNEVTMVLPKTTLSADEIHIIQSFAQQNGIEIQT